MFSLLFIADIHGSTGILTKALRAAEKYRVDLLIIGGDLKGKFLIPILSDGKDYRWEDPVSGSARIGGSEALDAALREIATVGAYGAMVDSSYSQRFNEPGYLDQLLTRLAHDRLQSWLASLEQFSLATGIAVAMTPGNDDDYGMDTLIREKASIIYCEKEAVDVGSFRLASIADVPHTPWTTYREAPETVIASTLESVFLQGNRSLPLILCAHCPPFASNLDTAPVVDRDFRLSLTGGIFERRPVGSKSLRSFLEGATNLPLSLHGHIHESRGFARIGGTLCLNPGSEYGRGLLQGYLVLLEGSRVSSFQWIHA